MLEKSFFNLIHNKNKNYASNQYNQISPYVSITGRIGKEKLKKLKKKQDSFQEQSNIPDNQKQIRLAIQTRYLKSKMNKQYVYEANSIQSSHSSELEEFKYLKNVKSYNLYDQNETKKIASKIKIELPKKFKIKEFSNNLIMKTQQSPQINKLRIKSKQEKSAKSQTKDISFYNIHNVTKKNTSVRKTKPSQNFIGQSAQFKSITTTLDQSKKNQKKKNLNKKKIKISNNNSSQDQQIGYANLTLNLQQKHKKINMNKNNLLIKTGITLGNWCGQFAQTESPYLKQFGKK